MAVSNNFSSSVLNLNGVVSLSQPTALVWGPDGRLYVTENGGQVNVLTVKFGDPNPDDDDNTVSFYAESAETIQLDIQNYNDDGFENGNSSRQVTGIDVAKQYDVDGNQLYVDPDGNLTTNSFGNTPAVTMYVTSSDMRVGAGGSGNDANLDTNSGVITMLEQTGSDSWNQVDIVRGLPRSEENHATNGLEIIQELDANGKLLSERAVVASGGNANTGAPSNNFAGQQEQPLSAAILEIDVTGLKDLGISTDGGGRQYIYDLPTLDDPTRSGESDNNDPNGGNDGLNSAKLDYDGLVTIYSPGYRNAYDVEVSEDGRVWTYDNGANNSWGGRPIGEAGDNGGTTDYAQDPDYISTNLNNGDGNSSDDINLENWNPSNNDQFHEITRSDDLDGRSLSVGGNGPVTTYEGPDGLTYVYGGHPNPTRAEGAKAGLLFSPDGGTDNAFLLVSNQSSYDEGTDDYAQVIAWLEEVETDFASQSEGDLTKKIIAVTPGVAYDIYVLADGSGVAVSAGQAAPSGGTLLGQGGLPADIADIVDWVNPVEGDYKEAGKTDGALDSGKGSINGLAEYTSTIMDEGGVKMSGAIIASVYNGGDLIIMGRNADGSMSSTGGSNAQAADRAVYQGSGQPLGLATIGDDFADRGLSQPFQGSIWSAVYGQNNQGSYTVHIEILQPNNGQVPLAGSEIVDPDDWDLDGVNKWNDPFEHSAENGMALEAGQKIVLDFDPQSTNFNGTLAGNTGLLGAALDGPGSQAGPLSDEPGTDNIQEAGATANQDARTGTYLENAGDLLAPGEQADGLYDIAGNIIPGGNAPILQIKEVVPGTMIGQGNTARDALHTAIRPADDVGRIVATVTAKNWVAGETVAEGQLVGMVYGDGTQSNFLRLVFGEVDGQPGFEVGYETGDANYQVLGEAFVPELATTDFSLVDLRLEIDMDKDFGVRAFYRLGDGITLAQTPFEEIGLGEFALPEGVLRDILTGTHTISDGDTTLSSGAAIGVVAETSDGNPLQAIDFHNIEIEGFGHEFEAESSADANAVQGTSGMDTVVLTGNDAAPVTLAPAVENIDASATTGDFAVSGNSLDNEIVVGSGQNTVTTGEGADTIRGTLDNLAGDEITDFSDEDEVILEGVSTDDLEVSYAAGSALVTINGKTIEFSGEAFEDFDPAEGDDVFTFEEVGDDVRVTTKPALAPVVAINAGGPAVTGVTLREQVIDFKANLSGGQNDGFEATGDYKPYSNATSLDADFPGTELDDVHAYERSSASTENWGYKIAVPDGNYLIDLIYAEIFHGFVNTTDPDDKRQFDVFIEGQQVEDNYDIIDDAGAAGVEVIKSYTATVTDGFLEIEFNKEVDQAKLSGLVVWAVGGNHEGPTDTTAPEIISIDVDNPQSVQDGERTATVVLSDETGFEEDSFAGLDGSELVFSGIVPASVSVPEVVLSDGGKTATLTYTLTAEGGAWPRGEGEISVADGAYQDAAGNTTGAAGGAFILEPNLGTMVKGSVALAINVGPTSNTTDDLAGDDDNTYGGAITNDTILGIDLQADDPSYYNPTTKTGSNIDGKAGSTGSNPELDGSALHTYRDAASGSFTATYPIENGVYVVELWFAELYHAAGGNRQGDYTINGEPWITDFDAFTAAGGADTPTMITKTVTVTDGKIVIDVDADTGEPGWNAIVVYEAVPADLPPTISVGDVTVAEGEEANVTFTRIGDSSEDVTVEFAVADGSATEGEDYSAPVTGTVVIPAGEATATIAIPTIDDAAEEPAETISVIIESVSNLSGDAVVDGGNATVTIGASDSNLQIPAGGTILDLDFETAGEPLDEGGFDDALGGAGALDSSVVTEVVDGKLVVHTSNGDLSSSDPVASKNDFVREVDLSEEGLNEIYITTQFDNPFTPDVLQAQGVQGDVVPNYAQQGIIIAIPGAGAQDPDNFVKLIFGGGGGNATQLWSQDLIDQKPLVTAMSSAAVADGGAAFGLFDIAKVELSLRIDKSAGEIAQLVTFYDDVGEVLGGVRPEATPGFVTAGPLAIPAAILAAIEAGAVDVGVTSTDYNTAFSSFEASWDFLRVSSPQHSNGPAIDAEGPSATVSLTAPDSESAPILATVVYLDDSGVDPSSIDSADLTLNGPSAASAVSVSFDPASNTATYTFEAPVGGWAEGDYTATVNAGELVDLAATPNANAGGQAASATLSFDEDTVNEFEPGAMLFRINAGGNAIAAIDGGPDWAADTAAAPSEYATSLDDNNVYTNAATDSAEEILLQGEHATSNVDGTIVPEAIFFHERSDNTVNGTPLEYTFPVEGGNSYYVTIYYTENWNGIGTGGPRQFDVAVNGVVPTEFEDINPYAESGETLGVAHKRTFLVTQEEGDTGLNLAFLHEMPDIQNPKVNGIEIAEAVPVSSDILVSVEDLGELIEDGDTGEQFLPFQVSLNDDTITGDLDLEVSVNGVVSVETLGFDGGVATLEVPVSRDARWNGPESISVEIVSVPADGYSADPSAKTANATILEDDPADTHEFGVAGPVVAGDYSDDRLTPTDIGAMQLGENILYATQQGDSEAGGRDRDYITFEVPEGMVLSALFLDGYATAEGTKQAFMGLQEGNAVTVDPITGEPDAGAGNLLTGLVYGEGLLANDLLPMLATGESGDDRQPEPYQGIEGGMLTSGIYTLWLNQGGAPTTVTLRAVVEAAPATEFALSISDADPVLEADGAALNFGLELDTPFTGDMEVTYDIGGETGLTQTITFVDGAGVLQVAVVNDDVDDGDESVSVTLTGATDLSADPTPVALGGAEAVGTVTEDDGLDPADIDGDGILNIDDPFAYDGANGAAKVLGPNMSFRQDFEVDTTDVFSPEAGFSGILVNPAFEPSGSSASDPYGDRTTEDTSFVEGGVLNIESSETDVFGSAGSSGANNSIKDNYQSAADVSDVDSFTVEAKVQGGFLGAIPQQFASFGITLGAGGTDDYIKFVFGGSGQTPRLQLAQENSLEGVKEENLVVSQQTPEIIEENIASIMFRLEVDKSSETPTLVGTAIFYDASEAEIGSLTTSTRTVTGSLAEALEGNNPLTGGTGGVAYGIAITDWDSGDANRFIGEWDYLEIKGPEASNAAPTLTLVPVVSEIAEDADTSASIKVADIIVEDDGIGSNELNLAGTNAGLFEIIDSGAGYELHLTAGASLDFETLSQLDVTVSVDDPEVGTTPDATAEFALSIGDVNEAPAVVLENALSGIAEDSDTSASIKVADIVVSDDALGTNTLELTGADAGLFQIIDTGAGLELHLSEGAELDAGANATLDVSVTVDDAEVGASPDSTFDLSLTVTDVANIAPTADPIDAGSVAEDGAPVVIDLLQGTSDSDGGSLGVANVIVEDALGNVVGYSQAESVLTIDPSQFANALGAGESTTVTVTYDVIDNQGGVTPNTATVVVEGTDAPVDPSVIDITFEASALSSYDDQDVTADGATISNDGDTLTLEGNTWKRLLLNEPLAVQEGMKLSFSFSSADVGEIVGIGLETDNNHRQNGQPFFQLGGSDTWSYGRQDFNGYTSGDGTVSFEIPLDDWAGHTFSHLLFWVDDDTGATGNAVFSDVQVIRPGGESNLPPIAGDDAVTVEADTALTIPAADLLANDSDPEGAELAIVGLGGPDASEGSVALVNGDVIFTPASDFAGETSFTYDVQDADGGVTTATVVVTVEAAENQVPVAGDDTVAAAADTPLTIPTADLLTNDSDPEGTALTIVGVNGPDASEGSVVIVNGDILFTPADGFSGATSFTYDVQDSDGGVTTATVVVTVEAAENLAPIAGDDAVTVEADTPLTISAAELLANDSDPEGGALMIVGVAGPSTSEGAAALVDGNVVFTPATGFSGTTSFTYDVADADGGVTTATVGITVEAATDPSVVAVDFSGELTSYAGQDLDPADYDVRDQGATIALTGNTWKKLALPQGYMVSEDSVLRFQLSSSFEGEIIGIGLDNDDAFNGSSDSLFQLGGVDRWDKFSVQDYNDYATSDGIKTYEISLSHLAGRSFDYLVVFSDADGADVSGANATFSNVQIVSEAAVNADPVAVADSFEIAGGETLTLLAADLTSNDSDADGDALVVTEVSSATGGAVSLADGVITFVADDGFAGSASFDYTVSDGKGGTSTTTVTVAVNTAPEGGSDSFEVAAGDLLTLLPEELTANDSDADGHDLTFVGVSNAIGGSVFYEEGQITFEPETAFTGAASFDYTIVDELGAETVVTVAIDVSSGIEPGDGVTDIVFEAEALSSYDDQDITTGGAIISNDGTTLELSGNTWKKLTLAEPLTVDADTVLRFTFEAGEIGEIMGIGFDTDNSYRSTPNQVLFQFAGSQNWAAYADQGYNAYEAGDGAVTIEIALGKWAGQSFTQLVFMNDDDADATATSTFSDVQIVQKAVTNAAPVAQDDPGLQVEGGKTAVIAPAALLANDSDPEGDALTIVSVGNATGGSVTFEDGLIYFTPAAGFAGDASFDYTVADAFGGTSTARVGLIVNIDPEPQEDGFETDAGKTLFLTPADLLGNDSDPDGDALTLAGVGNATGGTVTFEDGQVTFVPEADFVGTASFEYMVADPRGGTATGTVTVNVAEDEAPSGTTDIDFTALAITSYAGQDEDPTAYTVTDTSLTLSGNTWKKVAMPGGFAVEEGDVLRFEFQASEIGEIMGIGLETNDSFSSSTQAIFQLAGSQNWGSYARQDFKTYQLAHGTVAFEIPLDEWTGQTFSHLVFINDDDAGGTASGTFSNVQLVKLPDNLPPEVTSPVAFTVDEGATAVGTIVANDPENGDVTYAIDGGSDADLFAIDAMTGELVFVASPDFEAPVDVDGDNVYDVVVSVSDGTAETTSEIEVSILDVNEAPTVAGSVEDVSLEVGTAGSVDLSSLALADPDAGDEVELIVTLADGSPLPAGITLVGDELQLADSIAEGSYQLAVRASDGTLESAESVLFTVEVGEPVVPTEPYVVMRINAFGSEVAATDGGPNWLADGNGNPNSSYLVTTNDRGDTFGYSGDPAALPAGVPEAVMDTARSSNNPFSYSIPVEDLAGDGTYIVRLYLAELFVGNAQEGDRVFDVNVEGQTPAVFDNIDLGADGAGLDVEVREFEATVTDGVLDLGFLQDAVDGNDNPIINAIEILSVPAAIDAQAPQATMSLSAPADADAPLLVEVALSDASGIDEATLGAEDLELSVGGFPVAASITFAGFADGVASYQIAAPAGGWTHQAQVAVALKAGEVLDLAAAPNGNVEMSQSLTIDLGGETPVDPQVLLRINAFGPEIAAIDGGPNWLADGNASANSPYLEVTDDRGDTFGYSGDAGAIPAGVPQAVLDTARSSDQPFAYNIPVADLAGNGDYTVRLYLAELFSGNASPGGRSFDVSVEGQVPSVFDDIDVASDGDAMGVEIREYQVTVTDGVLNLEFLQDLSDNPIVNAIEIIGGGLAGSFPDTQAPVATMTLTNPNGADAPILVDIALSDNSGIDVTTLGAEDLEFTVGGFPVAANITFTGFAGGVAQYEIAAPSGGWTENLEVGVVLKAGEIADFAATPNVNASVSQALTIEFGGSSPGPIDPPADPTEALAILQDLDDVDSGASYGSGAVGSAELRIMEGNNSVQASNYGSNSFEIENTGDKQVAAVFIDFRNALYGDSIVDHDGSAGDNAAKEFAVNSGGGETGAFFETNDAGTYFLPGADPLPNDTGTGIASSGGWRGLLLKFDGTGFTDGEVVGFSGDMDPNSIAGLDKSGSNGVDPGAINGWDVGGVSGAELIGSSFTVMFDDGTFATGYLGSDGSQAGSVGTAVQNRAQGSVELTVNGFSSADAGTYEGTIPEIVVTGTPGATVLVTMSRGVNPVTNTSNGIADLVDDRLDAAQPEFPANNAADFQTAEVTIGSNGTATVPSDAFDYGEPAAGGQDFSGTAFTPGFTTAPVVVAASVVGSDGTPTGSVERVYLTNPTGTPVEGSDGGGTPGTGADGYYELIGSGNSARFKVQIEDGNANGGSAPAGKWNFEDSPDAAGRQAGFQGDGYYLYGSSTSTAINGVIESEILDYTIYVPEGETGTYTFRFRVARDGEEASDQQNDLLFNFFEEGSGGQLTDYLITGNGNSLHQGSGDFAKIFGGPNNGNWGFANSVDGSTSDPSLQVEIEEAGLYHVQIAGRSQGYHVDYWEAFKGGAPSLNTSNSSFVEGDPVVPVDPEPGEGGVIRKAISAGSDDTDQNANGGSVNLGKTDLELGDSGRDVGLRFTDLDLARLEGVDITDAYIEFTTRPTGGNTGTINASIAIEDSISAATFSSGNTPMDRDQFDFIEWSDSVVPSAGEEFRTANFSDLLEDFIIAWQNDLGASDDIAFILEEESGVRKVESFEGGDAPVLVIEYEELN